ncbi:ABC transporter substrate-binding protein [Anabaenopsis elenkinii]|uniref:ABC transporter substrate-binding protein n=1 Tax=Anabaenopsis elenkinii CCIBt3563 TaxID=2779889 RepID=A0A7U3NMK3_9CYAN|nr:ABC transporter substrate-binding protein [Anabaenopsis elenkinii]QOV21743.1 ABC transporter substrate-binding protein [Anabaenopsis elenkinii CCIBt3563]
MNYAKYIRRIINLYGCLFLFVATLVIACNHPNLINSCGQTYDPNLDYFPVKATINYAQGFDVEYHKAYKVVTVKSPWRDANRDFKYVLVQCGAPVPENFRETQVITVPVDSVVSLSTTHLPHFTKLGLLDKLLGVRDFKQVNTPEVVERIKAGNITEVGRNNNTNIEQILELNPALITTYAVGNTQTDSYPQLLDAGLKVAINAEYMENSPLGRSEWIKFTALFFNQEEKAEKVFNQIASKYEEIAAKTQLVNNRPTVFVGFNFQGTWFMPAGDSYVAKYLNDAGANYLWSDDNTSGSLPLSFEVVLERAANADYWLNFSQSWQSLQDLLNEDQRYNAFQAVKTGNLYNNDAQLNEYQGNDYWESGISNPDIVLSDLIKIFHPQILPKHQLVYYRKLT